MADNEPAESHLEVESVLHDSIQAQTPQEEKGTVTTGDQVTGDEATNVSSTHEPKEDSGAPEPSTMPNTEEAGEGPVATALIQAANPAPLDDSTTSSESQALPSTSATEMRNSGGASLATPTPTKRFTSMNINKKFLAKTSAGSPNSSNSPSTPKASTSASAVRPAAVNPQPSSRLVTKKLTATVPAASASGGWSLRPTPPTSLSSSPAPGDVSTAALASSAKSLVPTDAQTSNRPVVAPSVSALSFDSRSSTKTSRDHSPVKAWATVPVSVGDVGRNLQGFPTAAEAAADNTDSKRPGVSAMQPTHPSIDTTTHGTDNDARDSFRGMHLDPNAHHWDEMEDESNDFLGEVIDFGDGKTYTVPPEDTESVTGTAFNKETRLGDDYDRSWPRSRRLSSDSETAQSSRFSQHHGLPPRQPLGDGRVLFNERSNRLEPARVPHPATGAFHQHAPPYAHPPPRPATRRNSALSSSDRPMMGHTREPPPHTRDPPPHTRDPPPHTVIGSPTDGKTQRLSDARSTHSPIERRSSFLHDDDRPRIGSAPPKSRIGDESVLGLRRETSRDSQLSAGDRQAWGQQASSHRASTELLHQTPLGSTGTPSVSNKPLAEPVSGSISDALSPLEKTNTSPTLLSPKDISATRIPETTGLPTVPAVLNEEREKFMKQAAERARRRKQEEEAAREEARERARKKAAELEALSKASLVTASPLVALTRQSSGAKSPAPKSPIPKSPLVAPSVLPPTSASTEALPKPKETPVPTSAAAAASSWRTKPKPEPNMASAVSKDAQNELSQTVPLFTGSAAADQESHVLPPPATIQLGGLGGMQPIEELGKADGPIEVLDFSDMSKLAGRRTSIASPSESHRRKRSVANDFLDEAPTKRSGPGQANTWNKETRPSENYEDRDRTGTLHGKHASASHKPASESPWTKSASATGSGLSGTTSRSGFKEAPISALDDVMLRIKGVLTDMHAEGEKPAALSTSFPPSNGVASDSIPAPAPVADAPSKAAQGVALRWIGTKTANWRDGMNKKVLGQTPVETQPTEPFAISRLERPDTPPPVWKAYTVRLNKSTVVRPPLSKKQASLAKLPPMPVRWDILTWDPPVERMSTKTLSRDDMLFPKTYLRGILSARVLLPSSGSTPEVQARLNESSTQRLRLSATVDVRTSCSPNMSSRPVPKSPAFMDAQWRKPQPATSPINNALELQDTTPASAVSSEGNQLETTSRSPPPHHQPVGDKTNVNVNSVTPSSSSKAPLRSSQNTDVTFHRSLHEKRPSNPPTVSFTVSSELDDPSMTEIKLEDKVVPDNCPILEVNGSAPLKVETRDSVVDTRFNESASGDKFEQTISGGKITQSPTPNSSVLLTPPVKGTTPWQTSNSRLPDTEYLKSVWQHASPKEAPAAENSLRGLADDFPSAIPHSVQEMKAEDEEHKSGQPTTFASSRIPHNAHRAFQQVPSPAPMNMQGYPSHMTSQAVPSRPIPVSSFSLPPPAPQITTQPTPYSPYVHPTPPALMYSMPPSRIAPSPAPGGPQMWVQGQAYGRPSPPAGMYPPQQGHAMSYPSPVSQLPPPLSKQHGGMNGNHGHHPMSSPALSHAMHMGSPAMVHVGHMGSPALTHAAPHMPGGPQHMYSGMSPSGGLGLATNMGYGAQRPTPQMMQQPPMQAPLPNGYPIVPGGSYAPAGYGRGAMRTPSDGMPHHMPLPHPQHAPVSPGTYHPNAYGRW